MQVQLIVANKSQKGEIIPVNVPAFRIGRAEDCHLRSTSSRISSQHCVISAHGNTVAVSDLGSKTGTFVNGERVFPQRELQDGDELTVGRHAFVVSIRASVTPPATSDSDFFELLSDSSIATPPPGNVVDVPPRGLQSPQQVANRPSGGQRPTSPPRRKTPSADENPTRHRIKIVGSVVAALCLFGFLGVWVMSEPTNPYGAVRITGTLTLDGEAVAGASIILHPRDREGGRVAGGITDRRGRFTVTTGTAPMANGAVPGEYNVTFTKIEIPAIVPTEMRHFPVPGTPQPRSNPPPSRKYVIPQKYGDPKTSGLSLVVEPPGKNSFRFELSSVVPSS